jgi:hypothetical protein
MEGVCVDLSVIIPSRNEEFLRETVADILKNKRGETEIIVGLDGKWSDPPFPAHPDVTTVYYPESIGQRAMTNQCVKLSRAKFIMKVDAHCAFDEGFDVKMIEGFKDAEDAVMAPLMRNLWVYDWKCYTCGKRVYQDKESICPPNDRHSEPVQMRKKMLWIAKPSPQSTAYCFDPEPHFQYHGDQKRKQTGDLGESMSLQGSAFMCTREKYWELNICDEAFGSWGSQGIEVAVKFWLSGGRVLVNRKTWYAHCFRTKPLFSFPYDLSGHQVQHAKRLAKEMFFKNKWDKAIHPLSWLVEKFLPIPGWTPEEITKLKEGENLSSK